MKFISILISTIAALTLTACPSKKNIDNGNVVVYMGDPMKLVEGAELNNQIVLDEFRNINTLSLVHADEFVKKDSYSKKARTSQKSLETSQAPPNENLTLSTTHEDFKVQITKDNQLEFQHIKDKVIFRFEQLSDNKFIKLKIISGTEVMSCDFLHFSQSENKNLFSFLVFCVNSKQDSSLINYIFEKNIKSNISAPTTDTDYKYIFGPGVKIGWPKNNTLNIDICGKNAKEESIEIKSRIKQWQSSLHDLLNIQISQPEKYAPYSDLNQHCIFLVDDYLINPNPKTGIFGITATTPDDNSLNLVDADTIIFLKEFKKTGLDYSDPSYYPYFSVTVLHELGHFFGLDHQFDGTESIMSYDFESNVAQEELSLFDYDIRAIQELYK